MDESSSYDDYLAGSGQYAGDNSGGVDQSSGQSGGGSSIWSALSSYAAADAKATADAANLKYLQSMQTTTAATGLSTNTLILLGVAVLALVLVLK